MSEWSVCVSGAGLSLWPACKSTEHTQSLHCVRFEWTITEEASTISAYFFVFLVLFCWQTNGHRQMARNWIEKRRNGCDIVTNSHVLNHSTTQHPNESTNQLCWSECERSTSDKIKKSHSKYRIERLMLSSYGVYCVRIRSHKYILGYIMEIYVRDRAQFRHPTRVPSRWVLCRIFRPHHMPACVNFKCNWHLCIEHNTSGIESKHSTAYRERCERECGADIHVLLSCPYIKRNEQIE